MPLASVLDKRYAVAALFIANPNEERFAVAGDEHVLFFVYRDSIFGEDGDGAIVGGFAYAHEGSREVVEGIGGGSCWGQKWEG